MHCTLQKRKKVEMMLSGTHISDTDRTDLEAALCLRESKSACLNDAELLDSMTCHAGSITAKYQERLLHQCDSIQPRDEKKKKMKKNSRCLLTRTQ